MYLPSHLLARRCDGPLLGALKAGQWVLLDELNLASQSVLEGLNALLDHRAEVRLVRTTCSCDLFMRLDRAT
jgi:midasin (ATPase involved in ribosome maturation)